LLKNARFIYLAVIPMLSVESVGFGFQHLPLFENVSFKIAAGEVFHLTGGNGAGKSTFLSLIAGYRRPTSGDIRYFDNGREADDRRAYIEFLPAEANGLYGRMDALSNILFWTRLRGLNLSREEVFASLKEWGLGHPLTREHFPVEKFSTGMKRRLALVRVLLSKSPFWLLDEPIYGLDAKGIELFRQLLISHARAGGMALVISHDLAPLSGIITKSLTLHGSKSPT
jgi:heme exporter protein A